MRRSSPAFVSIVRSTKQNKCRTSLYAKEAEFRAIWLCMQAPANSTVTKGLLASNLSQSLARCVLLKIEHLRIRSFQLTSATLGE